MSDQPIDFQARLLELAVAQDLAQKLEAVYKEKRAELEATHGALAAQAVANATALEQRLRNDALTYVQETGDLDLHPSLTFRRTWKWEYDADAAIAFAQANGLKDCYTETVKLNVRKFEALLLEPIGAYFEARRVGAPTIAIAKLGDLLIQDEVDRRTQGNDNAR